MIGEQQVVQSVRVTNTNDFRIVDRFDGVPYEFEPGKPLSIPLDAAFHIFGWIAGRPIDEIFAHTQRRFGWNTPAKVEGGIDRKFFGRLKIEPVVYKMVEVRPDDQPEPETPSFDVIAPPKKRGPGRPPGLPDRMTREADERIAADEADRETARRLQEHIDKKTGGESGL